MARRVDEIAREHALLVGPGRDSASTRDPGQLSRRQQAGAGQQLAALDHGAKRACSVPIAARRPGEALSSGSIGSARAAPAVDLFMDPV